MDKNEHGTSELTSGLAYYIDAISIPEEKGRERNTHTKNF